MAEAQIRHTLGSAYWSIGEYEIAKLHFERALEIGRDHQGSEYSSTIEWMNKLGWKANISLRDGIRSTYEFYKEQMKD